MNKYCRICWNTANWQQPTGEARLQEGGASYVVTHGFGHEEWLFNFEWLLSGYNPDDPQYYKYGFLQPIGKYRHAYDGLTFSVLLYTVDSTQTRNIVARIDNLYVPYEAELNWALDRIIKNGWLTTMRQQLTDLGLSAGPLLNPPASSVTNIRFRPEDIAFYDPMLVVEENHKITRINRYQPLDWDDGFPPVPTNIVHTQPPANLEDEVSPERSEAERTRAAQKATIYDPKHTRLQNGLYRSLLAHYGKGSVLYEEGFVDLTLIQDTCKVFIEIKTHLTVKMCIRSAVGQLLEYAYYPNQNKADKLLVVGNANPTLDDIAYLQYIRDTYNLPIYYARWSWGHGTLDNWI